MSDETIPTEIPLPTINTDPKMWYTSAELWTAIVSLASFILQGIFGNFALPMDVQASIVVLLMAILRAIRPPRPIAWTKAHYAALVQAIG